VHIDVDSSPPFFALVPSACRPCQPQPPPPPAPHTNNRYVTLSAHDLPEPDVSAAIAGAMAAFHHKVVS